VIEGPGLVREALAAGLDLEEVFAAPDVAWTDTPVTRLAPGVIEAVATTEAPQGVIAVARLPFVAAVPAGATFVVVCEGIGDPGNAGTILRSAEAAGADAVVFTPGSVDPSNPKCVRASAGALFHVPVVVDADPLTLGLPLVGTVVRDGTPHTACDLRRPLALVLGSEAHGLSPALAAVCADRVTIEHAGRAESLNVAMAAAILCFEVRRQRVG
jgi:TrmH family RNA methyltransferase